MNVGVQNSRARRAGLVAVCLLLMGLCSAGAAHAAGRPAHIRRAAVRAASGHALTRFAHDSARATRATRARAAVARSATPATACTTSWAAAASGSWNDSTKWTNGVPSSTCAASITVAGTYTVTISGVGDTAASLTLGGSSGTQTVTVDATDNCSGASNGTLALGAGGTIGVHGVVDLTQTGNCSEGTPELEVSGGSLTNSGTIQTALGSDQTNGNYPAYLDGTIINTGSIDINQTTSLGTGISDSSLDNKGALTLGTGDNLDANNNATVTDDTGGSITNGGSTGALVMNGGTYNQGAGTTSPTAVDPTSPAVLLNGSALDYTGTGASSIVFRSTGALSGNLAAGQNLTLQATDFCNGATNAQANTAASFTNAGDIDLTQTGNCSEGTPLLEVTSGTLTNSGTIQTNLGSDQTNGNYPAYLDGAIVNTGAIDINASSDFGAEIGHSSLDDKGALALATGDTLNTSSGDTVTDDTGGSITNGGGTGGLIVNGGTYNQGAGTTSPTAVDPTNPAVLLNGSALDYTGTGASSIVFRSSAALSGSLAAGQNLTIQATDFCGGATNGEATASASFTNAGDIELTQTGNCAEGTPLLELSAGTLTNSGTIQTDLGSDQTNGNYPAYLDGAIVNTGAIDINASAYFGYEESDGSLDNKGSLTIATGDTLNTNNGATVTDDTGGSISNGTGTGELVVNDGTYDQAAGTISQTSPVPADPAVLLNATTLKYTGKGKGTIVAENTTAETGNLATGQNLDLQATDFCSGATNAELVPSKSLTNSATISFSHTGNCGEGTAYISLGSKLKLTNKGTLSGVAGSQAIDGELTNTGTVSVAAGITLTLDGTLTNMNTTSGTLKGGKYTLTGTFQYENSAFDTNGITDNDGAITLIGSGAFTDGNSANALRNLATNAKTLTLSAGAGLSTAGSLADAGTIALGGGSTLSVGGGYTQSSKGVLTITLASASSYGALNASGPSSLTGTLDLDQTYAATAGTSETVLSSSARTGTFAKVVVKNTGGKGSATPAATYTATGVTVTG